MHVRYRLARLFVPVLAAWAAATSAHAQAFAHILPSPYKFSEFEADLTMAGAKLPPEAVLDAYREAITGWSGLMREARPALEKQVGTRFDVIPPLAEAERGLQGVRCAQAAALAIDERLIASLSASIADGPDGDAQRLALERVRDWRRTVRATPKSVPGIAMLQLEDIGVRVRRLSLDDVTRGAALDRLAESESARRSDLLALQRHADEGSVRMAAAAEKLAAEGNEGGARRDDSFRAATCDPALVGAVYASQLRGLDAMAKVLPADVERNLRDAMHIQCVADQSQEYGLRFPAALGGEARSPAQLGQILLAWVGLEPARHDATLGVISEWIGKDDEIVAEYLASLAKSLQAGEIDAISVGLPTRLQGRRGELTQTMLPKLVESSGAGWLEAPSPKPIVRDFTRLTDADRAIVGVPLAFPPLAQQQAMAEQFQSSTRRKAILPVEFDAWFRARLAAALDPDALRTALLEAFIRDHSERWKAEVEPAVDAALAADRVFAQAREDRDGGNGAQAAGEPQAIQPAIEARRAAFAAAARVDAAFFESARAAFGDEVAPTIARLEATRRTSRVLTAIVARERGDYIVYGERLGGVPVDLATIPAAPKIPAAVRDAIERELQPEWASVCALADEMLAARLSALAVERLPPSGRDDVGDPEGTPAIVSRNAERREAALLALVDRWRAMEDRLVPRMLAAADSAGDPDGRVRRALDAARFPMAMNPVIRAAALVDSLDEVTFEGDAEPRRQARATLNATVAEVGTWIDSIRRRETFANLTEDERMGIDTGQGWRSLDLSQANESLYAATVWYLRQRVPTEVLVGVLRAG